MYVMIPSPRKVGKGLFEALMKKGRYCVSESFSARILTGIDVLPIRFSVVVAKKLERSAVLRNTYKRRVYSLLRLFLNKIQPGTVCAMFLKKKINKKDLPSLAVELETFFKKSNIIGR